MISGKLYGLRDYYIQVTRGTFRGAPAGHGVAMHWLLGRAGSWSGDWTVEHALDLARVDGEGPSVGILGWLETNRRVPMVLRGSDLRGKGLSGADLRWVNLRGATVRSVDIMHLSGVVGSDDEPERMRGAR